MRSVRKNNSLPYLMLLPATIVTFGVSLYPAFYGIERSLYTTSYTKKVAFVGLQNYFKFLSSSRGLLNVENSLIYVVSSLILAIAIGMVLAIMLNEPMPGRDAFRTILMIPWITSQTVTGLLWGWLANPTFGPVTYLATKLFGSNLDLLGVPHRARVILIGANVWMTYPYAMVLLLAGLQTIPHELYESAAIDGASKWKSFLGVTLPIIRPVLLITTIMVTLTSFNMVTLIYTLTGGGPAGATEVLSLRVFLDRKSVV